jgi:hypothetical protein
MKNHLKPMGIRDILDSTFTILRENFWTFLAVFVKAFLPAFFILLLGVIATIVYFVVVGIHTHIPITNPLFWSEIGNGSFTAIILGIILLILVIIAFVIALCIGGIYFTYGNFKIFTNGLHEQKTSPKEAFQGIKGNRLRMFLVQLIVTLLLYIITIPGFIGSLIASVHGSTLGSIIFPYINLFLQLLVGFFFCMALPVTVFEKLDVVKSINRGFQLMARHRWRIFWTLLLVYILGYVLGFIILGISAIPIIVAALTKNIIISICAGVFCIGGLFILILLSGYFFGPLTAIYYDLIIRKEGYDITMQLADDSGVEYTTPPLQI